MTSIVYRLMQHHEIDTVAEVVAEAFADLQERTGFPEDLSNVELCREEVACLYPDGMVAVDECTGRIVGANFLSQFEPTSPCVRAVGPLAVSPRCQSANVGRQLMLEIVKLARSQGATSIRLGANCHNVVAVSLYTTLGFHTKDSLAILSPWKPNIPRMEDIHPDYEFRRMEKQDIEECCRLMKQICGYDRPRELEYCVNWVYEHQDKANLWNWPYIVRNKLTNNIEAFSTGFHVASWHCSTSQASMKHLIDSFLNLYFSTEENRQKEVPEDIAICVPMFHQPELSAWCLSDKRFRMLKLMNHMVLGDYTPPNQQAGVYFPSVEY